MSERKYTKLYLYTTGYCVIRTPFFKQALPAGWDDGEELNLMFNKACEDFPELKKDDVTYKTDSRNIGGEIRVATSISFESPIKRNPHGYAPVAHS